MKLKFKTLYDPKQKCFIHLQNFGDVFTSSTPNLMKETATLKKIEELNYILTWMVSFVIFIKQKLKL
jgi:hypothetical protein